MRPSCHNQPRALPLISRSQKQLNACSARTAGVFLAILPRRPLQSVPEAPAVNIVLISPKGPLYRHRGGIFKRSLRYAPLTLTTLAALVPPEIDATLQLIDEGIEDVDPALDADLVGMTVITGTAIRAYELAARFRARGIPV